jgi:hypothetical protein
MISTPGNTDVWLLENQYDMPNTALRSDKSVNT